MNTSNQTSNDSIEFTLKIFDVRLREFSNGYKIVTAGGDDNYFFERIYPKGDIPPHNSDYGLIGSAMLEHDVIHAYVKNYKKREPDFPINDKHPNWKSYSNWSDKHYSELNKLKK